MGWRIYAAVWLVVAGLAQVSPDNQICSAKLVRNFDILFRNKGNQVHCTHSDQRHQLRILIWAGGFTQPSGWLWLAWPRSAQATKFAVPNWFVILTRNMGNQVHCTHSDQQHQPRILIWAGGFTQPSWLWLAWPRSAQTTKFAVPNWFVILTFCSEIWVTRSIALTLTSDISRGF